MCVVSARNNEATVWVLHGEIKAIEVLLNFRLVGPVEVANEFDETHGIIRSGTGMLVVQELQ